MHTELLTAIFGGLALLITTTVSAVMAVKNGRKSDVIHALVNSRMSDTLAELASARAEVARLEHAVATCDAATAISCPMKNLCPILAARTP